MRTPAILVTLLLCALSWGHDLSLTRIEIQRQLDGVQIRLITPISKLVRLEQLGPQPSSVSIDLAIRHRLSLWVSGSRFVPKEASLQLDTSRNMLVWTSNMGSALGAISVQDRFYPEDASSRTVVSNGSAEIILDESHPHWDSRAPGMSVLGTAVAFARLGVEHILSGLDHILFVIGLVLLGGSIKALLNTVTAFTLAHSITLSLAVTGIVHPNPRIVEPLIALSILAIAVENLRQRVRPNARSADFRPWIAFAFGLIHGFGFADALVGIGLRGVALAEALISFNLGVELGQAAVLMVGIGCIALLSFRWAKYVPKLVTVGSTLIGMVGSYWFVGRLFIP